MQTICPALEQRERQLKKRGGRGNKNWLQKRRKLENIRLGRLTHKGTPGWAF